MDTQLTIIIPIYNEEENMDRLYKEMAAFLPVAKKKTKILFIDDGSKDKSLEHIRRICDENPSFNYISFDKNYGLSAAIKAGFDQVSTPWVGYIDADLQTQPSDFNILLDYAENYDLVTGVRVDRKDSFIKNMSSKIANGIRRSFTNDCMNDTGCPLKIIKTKYAKKIPMFNGLHRFLPAMILLQNGKIIQVPVSHFPRLAGKSKFNVWNRLIGPLCDCFAYVWMKKKYINYTIKESKNE
ncbi:glycosyltransferase family 2 protein [Flavobacterium luminosum]|uniref:Glycosyltransferase family 2 protein n=1 Tax=Flavobacterium luminosum TaxID=2949086 RepID=A0ABT0TNM3_9FLAO|nr:glycosyltransferase family 2 protein [Flavobacterium sp. HXWNR70]MCL9808950.1 glycosyltransferase family 2 protein [Flavobacterium sp. HXWNR70]